MGDFACTDLRSPNESVAGAATVLCRGDCSLQVKRHIGGPLVMQAFLARNRARRASSEPRGGSSIPEDIRAAFDTFDRDGDGVDKYELKTALNQLNISVKSGALDKLMRACLGPGATTLDIEQFDMIVQAARTTHVNRQPLRKEEFTNHSILGENRPLPFQKAMRDLYTHPVVVYSVATIIVANFVANIIEKEYDPDTEARRWAAMWDGLDLAFNIVFLLELLFNMYGYGGPVRTFWGSGWNVFDFVIVSVGVVLMTGMDLGAFNRLKLLRAFRIFRLFKRIRSLNKIIEALLAAVPGVFNAFVIMFIFFCIYAILAVELFRPFGEGGTYEVKYYTDNSSRVAFFEDVSSLTARGYSNGYEYYGTFSRAMFTLFQVMTGESWSEAIARPIMFGLYDTPFSTGLFFVSFVILTQIVLLNVVVVVLLDNFDLSNDPKGDTPDAAKDGATDTGADTAKDATKLFSSRDASTTQPPAASDASRGDSLILAELKALRVAVDKANDEISRLSKLKAGPELGA